MPAHLYIQIEKPTDLESIFKRIFSVLNVATTEIHDSVNYPNGLYEYAEVLGLKIKLMEAASTGFPDYQFCIVFTPKSDWTTLDRHCLDGFADIVARYLAQNGMKIARPLQPGRIGSAKVLYGHSA